MRRSTGEAVAVSAADGYARATGDPAVAYLHSHLGLANGLGHLDAALEGDGAFQFGPQALWVAARRRLRSVRRSTGRAGAPGRP